MKRMTTNAVALLSCLSASSAFGQTIERPAPTYSDVAYGPFARNVLDLWLPPASGPTPLVMYFHPGGFMQGDKRGIQPALVVGLLSSGIAVASVNYRLTDTAPFPAPMLDGARSVQYLRSRAADWNLDPSRFGAIGGSAGGGIALWIGFHDDMADATASDPVLRESTRIQVVVGQNAQASYDPRWIAQHIGVDRAIIEAHPFFEPFFGLTDAELSSPELNELFEAAAPIEYVSAGDPPVFLYYWNLPRVMRPNADADEALHTMQHGVELGERLEAVGSEAIVRHMDDYGLGGVSIAPFGGPDAIPFFVRHLSH